MATAKANPIPAIIIPATTEYTLTLSAQETTFLADLLQLIGGCPSTSRRKHAQAIYTVLREAGVGINSPVYDVDRAPRSHAGIYFTRENNPDNEPLVSDHE